MEGHHLAYPMLPALPARVVPRSGTGTYSVQPDCTATASLTILTGFPVGANFHLSLAIIGSGDEIKFIQIKSGTMFTGNAERQ